MKLHVGAGSIYLRGYTNVDLPLEHVFLTAERPDLVERYGAEESDYYGRHEAKNIDEWRKGPVEKETVCDVYGSFDFLPARNLTVDEILSRQCFEHLTIEKARPALTECARVLKWGGYLRLDVPDPEKTLELYRETGDSFYKRHLLGPRQDQFGFHTFYNRETLLRLAADCGFNFVEEERNIHTYPAVTLKFVRS